ncbi:MAG: ATP-dependent DNA helicase RecG [Myxococcota bacterium]
MGESPFQSAICEVLRPIELAAQDDFAGLSRDRDLPRTVALGLQRISEMSIPPDLQEVLAGLARDFLATKRAGASKSDSPTDADDSRIACITAARKRLAPMATAQWSEAQLAKSPSVLPGFGKKRAESLARCGLGTVGDLLFYLPARYEDRRSLTTVGELEVGRRASFVARVLGASFSARRGRFGGRVFEARVGDQTGSVSLKWFRGGESLAKQVRKDVLLLVSGDVKRYRFDKELAHPEISVLSESESDVVGNDGLGVGEKVLPSGAARLEDTRRIVPGYATPEGIHPRGLRRAIALAVERYADFVPGYLPEPLCEQLQLPAPAQSLRELHLPDADADIDALAESRSPARTRLALEELYLLELGLALRRAGRAAQPGTQIAAGRESARAMARLPFALTSAQDRVLREILADLGRPHPMNRLLEGDVGCGKTVVAFLAAVAVAEAGHQTAMMAPTELLAEQHEATLNVLAHAIGQSFRVARLTASLSREQAALTRRALAAGEIDLVVGTHALFQQSVDFRALVFVVIDEQHRFGVRQRAALSAKALGDCIPHTLVMTATPIPRTLALTLYGDLDLSVIDELPAGRTPAETRLLRSGEAQQATVCLRAAADRGEQIYVVYPLVAESEKIDLRAASESADKIRTAFPDLAVDLVHGQMDAEARRATMARFARGETQVLVSTTVIEVGVDVPNATLMIVEHAERFGLAQLHQLRGRVGRGQAPSTCVLVARSATQDSEARLSALLETTDGFAIAEADLRIRGPGEFLGTQQHGRLPDLKIADLARDARHIATAREAALDKVRADPGLSLSQELARAVVARWGKRLEWVGVG